MFCTIYKSPKKLGAYLYLADKDDFTPVPDVLLRMLGDPIYLMELELNPVRKLAQEDVREVIRSLQEQGWFLQLPRQDYWRKSQ
ncbi:MAG: YcgL domain-containing protein [Candidatus Competibacteraceae bacterium]|nr:YcgL domain-containing protein [Candidatus Competibacteraceae bacterium]